MVDTNFRLGLYEGRVIVQVQEFPVGTHTFKLGQPAGNSLLSTIYVRAIDGGGSVKVNYFDTGPGDGDEAGERIELQGHPLVSAGDDPVSDRKVIGGISNKPVLEIVVTGAAVEIGVHIAVVADFPMQADPSTFFKTYPGVPYYGGDSKFVGVTTPGIEQTPISQTVPVGTRRHLHNVIVACRVEATYKIYSGEDVIGSGRTGPGNPNSKFPWSPFLPVEAGTTISVKVTARSGLVVDLEVYLQASDETI